MKGLLGDNLLCGVISAKRGRRRKKMNPVGIFNDGDDASHEGIKTVSTDDNNNNSNLSSSSNSTNSDICICIVTWNMNGQLLTTKDQLLQEAERGQVFNGYCEGTLAFKPTYKYNVGTSDYDTSCKVRVPAWTDRILFKTDDNEIDATLHFYDSIEGIFSSDHKPVKAHLCLKLNNS